MSFSPRSKRLLVPALTVAVLAVGLAIGLTTALATSSSPAPSSKQLTLRIGWATEPDNLNPFIGWENCDYEIWSLNYSFLFGSSDGFKPTLDLAREFPTVQNGGLSADGKTWTIHLKTGVKWSDGQPFTADDVAFTYNYIVKNHMMNMAITTIGITGAKALDPQTVQIYCSRPKADMEYLFLPILPKHVWEKVTPQAAQSSYVSQPPVVGTGPFITTAFKRGGYVEMKRNPNFWGTPPTIDRILFVHYTNDDTMASDLRAGTIAAAWGVSQGQFDSIKSTAGIEAVAYNFFNWDYLNFNCFSGKSLGNPVLRDWHFRNALNYAVDRQALCRSAYQSMSAPGTTILPPDTWTDPDFHWQPPADQAYTFDVAKANQLLDQAGYTRGAGGIRQYQGKPITLRLETTTESSQELIETKLIAGWFKQLGLQIKLSVVSTGVLESQIFNFSGNTYIPNFDMYVWDWAGYSDPGQTLTAETSAQIGSTNEPCWSNAEYDKLNAQQASALDRNARKDIIWKMQQIMYQQTPWVVLTYPQYLEAYNTSRWTGWTRMFHGRGPAFLTTGYYQSYIDLKPKATTSSGSNTGLWIGIAAAAVVVAGLVVWVVLRRRPTAEET